MKEIKVLGTGCAKCTKTVEVITKIANELNIDVHVVKETDLEVIMGYGVMSTPAVIIDEINVHSGSIPHREHIESWLRK
ncbi:thioredoxin family protein [Colwellia psychrerythraea]|jgi:small redox-active disulfide protein 2|uniref:Redox-active disulfide protein 2 n=1 Tax=Colwellia psychrerythraea (strain 34H / ATCC BAA-681) TaxID=167879 RepID=Q47YT8_COLP3|nr:thioredoxin family protein [Colwellia psychrerythraea]AAZ27602.1 redox-active disulfide protein 2 [Colwellia psychrerythraea 34H]